MSKHQIATELHGAARRNYTRRRVNVYGKNDLFQADLVEMIPYSRQNKGHKYILCVIDCFTKFAWAIALKSKKGTDVTAAIETIFSHRRPRLLHVDRGKEFYNKNFESLLKKYNVKMYSTYSTMKACIVERFNRTLKTNMFRRFTGQGNHKWVVILPDLMSEYNNSKHRTIGMTPAQADENSQLVQLKQRQIKQTKNKFKIGDKVRISVYKSVFTKSYLPSWSTEIFTVVKVNNTVPPTFMLEDYTGERIAGGFYTEEIRKTEFPDDYLVQKILKTKNSKLFVKWLGFDDSHNSWINKADVKT